MFEFIFENVRSYIYTKFLVFLFSCCLHSDNCNPNEEIYEKVETTSTALFDDIFRSKEERKASLKHHMKSKFIKARKAYFAASRNFMKAAKAYLAAM